MVWCFRWVASVSGFVWCVVRVTCGFCVWVGFGGLRTTSLGFCGFRCLDANVACGLLFCCFGWWGMV